MLKIKCDNLEKAETDKFLKERNEKIKLKTDQLTQKHFAEKNTLKSKLDTEYEIMKKEKDDEMTKIILKFKNRKLDLEMQQKQEKKFSENENLQRASKNINLFFFQKPL